MRQFFSNARVLGFGAVIAFVAASLIFSAAEASLRLFYFGPQGVLAWSHFSPRTITETSPPFRLVWTSWRLIPGVSGYLKGMPFSVNSYGMRDLEILPSKPDGVCRIAVLGDSFTMGTGVRLSETYVKILERLLNADSGRSRFEVLNFGVAGYDFELEVEDLERHAMIFKPDIVIFGMNEFNDLPLNGPPSYLPRSKMTLWLRKIMPDSFLAALVVFAFQNYESTGWIARMAKIIDWEIFEKQLYRLKGVVRGGPTVIIALLQDLGGSGRPPWSSRLRRTLTASGFTIVDTVPEFNGQALRRYWIYLSDTHPNKAAHEMYARVIYDAISREGILRACRHVKSAGPIGTSQLNHLLETGSNIVQ